MWLPGLVALSRVAGWAELCFVCVGYASKLLMVPADVCRNGRHTHCVPGAGRGVDPADPVALNPPTMRCCPRSSALSMLCSMPEAKRPGPC